MGVPKFFRYISERYPCLSELAREQSIPEFDNLYLDMNGIIHNCSHPDDSNIHFTITEEEIFKDIFNYIDKLFFLIKPQQLFFMAVDGVAPRAKMNQQRSRRFRSAKDAELLEQQAMRKGEVRSTERFDSNCITPGTVFMMRLHEALQYFIKGKITVDPLWQKCRVILSGQNFPGEGEHKIMDYIRYLKAQAGYNPNTRHCLYGLDADLTILGLCTHELHFVVLREEVKFGSKPKRASVEETRFFLLHLGLFREYLELEFDALRYHDDTFDIAQLIDDWVLMGFLVGNDFIPHLPCLHISSNALPLLYKTYMKVYPTLGGNINDHGKLNLERLEKYFAALAEVEFDIFQENYADLKYFEAKQTKNGIDEAFDFDVEEITSNANPDNDLAALIESSRQFMQDGENDEDLSDDDGKHIADEFETYKRNYYMKKLDEDNMCSERKREQAIGYITALQWILDYYYRGVQSWDWYYPHHYAPFISDLKNFKDHVITFNMGEPFRPFEQLLAVLPAGSKQLLPLAYQELMTSVNSTVISYYPNDFETDLNGKKHEWEAVVLIPFIDEKVLLGAMKACESHLTPSERLRNEHGPMLQYDHSAESQGMMKGIGSMKSLYSVFCTERPLWAHDIAIDCERTVCVELPNAARHVFFPGFPTMKHLQFKFQLRLGRVKVFDHPSRNENMILKPQNRHGFDDAAFVADKYLNKIVYIGWPHLIKAKVVGVFDVERYIGADTVKDTEPKMHDLLMKAAQEHLTTRMGIEFADFSVMVHVCIHVGTSFVCGSKGKVSEQDSWSVTPTAYPAQGIVAEIAVHNALQQQERKIEELFPTDTMIFFVGNPYFGSEGTVVNPFLIYECGRLKVNITVLPEPDFTAAKFLQGELSQDYVSTHQAAAFIAIHPKCLGRVTGTVLVIAGARRSHLADNIAKTNIGLQLKYPKQNEERAGYARRINNQWYYSSKAIATVQAYYERYPMVIDYLSAVSERNEYCFETDLFPASVGEGRVEEICAWLKEQPHMTAERVACGSKTLEEETVQLVIDAVEHLKNLPLKTVKLQVKPHLLLKPDVSLPDMYRASRPLKLFDRIVIVRTTYMVPLGSKGTVVGIYPVSDPNPVRLECVNNVEDFYEVLFDKILPNGNDIHGMAVGRVYKVPSTSVLLIFTPDNAKNELLEGTRIQPRMEQKQQQQQQQQQHQQPQPQRSPQQHSTQQSQHHRHGPSVNGVAQSDASTSRRKGGDDFWMPAADTKAKHSQSQNQHQNSNHNHLQQQQQQHNTTDPAKEHKQRKNASNGNGNKQIQILQKGVPLPMPPHQQQQKQQVQLQQQQPPPPPPPLSLAQMQAPILPMQMQMQMQMPMPLPQAQLHAQLPQNDSTQEKTLMLKNLLGLTKPTDDCDKREAPRKLLPQPPQGWRTDAQTRVQMPASSTVPPLAQFLPHPSTVLPSSRAKYNHGYMMMPMRPTTYGMTRMPIGATLQQPIIPQAYSQPPAFYPVIASNLVPPCAPADNSCFSPESLNQKGAFIPLQAMRNGPSSQPLSLQQTKQRNASSNDGQHRDELVANLSELKLNATSGMLPTTGGSPMANNVKDKPEAAPTAKAARKRAPRVPKIGARFDNMH